MSKTSSQICAVIVVLPDSQSHTLGRCLPSLSSLWMQSSVHSSSDPNKWMLTSTCQPPTEQSWLKQPHTASPLEHFPTSPVLQEGRFGQDPVHKETMMCTRTKWDWAMQNITEELQMYNETELKAGHQFSIMEEIKATEDHSPHRRNWHDSTEWW